MTFRIPQIGFGGKPVEGSLERVVGGMTPQNTGAQVTPQRVTTSRRDPKQCIFLPGRSHGAYTYKDTLVEKDIMYLAHENHYRGENSWQNYIDLAQKEGWHLLALPQYVDFLRMLRDGPTYDGAGTRLSDAEREQLFTGTIRATKDTQSEWLDTLFNLRLQANVSGPVKTVEIGIPMYDSQGKLSRVTRDLEHGTLMNGGAFEFNHWLDKTTAQGMPSTIQIKHWSDVKDSDMLYTAPSLKNHSSPHAVALTAKPASLSLVCTRTINGGTYYTGARRAYAK